MEGFLKNLRPTHIPTMITPILFIKIAATVIGGGSVPACYLYIRNYLRSVVVQDDEAETFQGQVLQSLRRGCVSELEMARALIIIPKNLPPPNADEVALPPPVVFDLGDFDDVKSSRIVTGFEPIVARYVRDLIKMRFSDLNRDDTLGGKMLNTQIRVELQRMKVDPTFVKTIRDIVVEGWSMPTQTEVAVARARLLGEYDVHERDSTRPVLGTKRILGLVDIPVLRTPSWSSNGAY